MDLDYTGWSATACVGNGATMLGVTQPLRDVQLDMGGLDVGEARKVICRDKPGWVQFE